MLEFESITPATSPGSAEIKAALLERGFADADSAAAASRHKTIFDALCWLIKNLPESDLPESYKPGDGGGLSVVTKSESSQDLAGVKDGGKVEKSPDERACGMYGVPEGDVQGVLGKFDGPSVFEKCHAAFAQFCSEDNAGGDNDDDLGTLEEQVRKSTILLCQRCRC